MAVRQKDGVIRGIYVAATDGDSIAVANFFGYLIPQVKPLTAAVANNGMTANIQPATSWTFSQASDSGNFAWK